MANEKKVLAIIFIVALALRLMAVINMSPHHQIPGGDAVWYDHTAIDLMAGKGYIDHNTGLPTAWRPPLYSLFLAAIYSIFGHSYLAVRVIQSFIGALLCILIYYIAREIFGKKVALLSSIVMALYVPFIYYVFFGGPGFLFPEIFFTCLITILVLFLIRRYFVQDSIKNGVIAGILVGLLTLTRPLFILFPIFLFSLLIYKTKGSFLSGVKKILPLLISLGLMISPWVIRNYLVYKTFAYATEGGHSFLAGNNPYANGSWVTKFDTVMTEEERTQLGKMNEVRADKFYYKIGVRYLIKDCKRIPKLFLKKLLALWDVYTTDYDANGKSSRVYNIWYSVVLTFALIGIIKAMKSGLNENILLLLLFFLYFSIIAMLVFSETRFRSSVEPFLIIFSSVGVFAIYNRFKRKILSYLVICGIVGMNLLFYIYSDLILNLVRKFI